MLYLLHRCFIGNFKLIETRAKIAYLWDYIVNDLFDDCLIEKNI